MLTDNDAEGKILGIGIGAPNANYYTGMIESNVNLPWPTPLPLAQLMSEKFGIRVTITNDANAAALGEMTYGAARGLNNRYYYPVRHGKSVISRQRGKAGYHCLDTWTAVNGESSKKAICSYFLYIGFPN